MGSVSSALCAARVAGSLARHPTYLSLAVLYWLMTEPMDKRTVAGRRDARAVFASRMLGVDADSALASVQSRREDADVS